MRIKSSLPFCLLLLCSQMQSQSHKTQFSFEYSPGLMRHYYKSGHEDEWRPVHSAFAKAGFYLNKRLDLTTGLGYFNTRMVRTVVYTDFTYGTYIHHYRNFLSIPVGIKYSTKSSFYLNLELAGAYNFGNPVIYKTFQNGEIIEKSRGEPESPGHLRKLVMPLFLSFGKEIPWKENTILAGLKSSILIHNLNYESYNSIGFYEFGLLLGIKWGNERSDGPTTNSEKQPSTNSKKSRPTTLPDTSVQFSIEYYPHRTGTRTGNRNNDTHDWSHNGFIKVEFPLNKLLRLTTGAGFLTAHDHDYRDGEMPDVVSITTYWSYHYATIPAGIKYQLGRFSINPEISLAYNFNNSNQQFYSDTIGYGHKAEPDQFPITPEIKRFAVPVILSLGYDIPLGKTNLIFGLKGHYGLNNFSNNSPIPKHFYGVGLMTAIKF